MFRRRELFLLSLLSAVPALAQDPADHAIDPQYRADDDDGSRPVRRLEGPDDPPETTSPFDEHQAQGGYENPRSYRPAWKDVDGREVRVEGIAWGGEGDQVHQILVDSAWVAVHFPKKHLEPKWEEGRLLRVDGVFNRVVLPPRKRWEQRRVPDVHYSVVVEHMEYLSKVVFPGVQVMDRKGP